MRKICIITGSRAEYGLLYWLMKEIASDPELKLQILATGQHCSKRFGETYKRIEADGFAIASKVEIPLEDDSPVGIAASLGTAITKIAKVLSCLLPDMVVLLGDRFEIFASASAAVVLKIPIAHIHGGELTYGAIDDAFRHAITKMATLHFAAAEPYRQRIIQMGESPETVYCVGAPGIDSIERSTLLNRGELEESMGFKLGNQNFVVTQHPVTRDLNSSRLHIEELLSALDSFPSAKIIFTGSNSDADNRIIQERIQTYVDNNKERAKFYSSLGQIRYLSLLKIADMVIGNSSSGIIEMPVFKKATINIGDRQKGRLMAKSVIQCLPKKKDIENAIQKALSPKFKDHLKTVESPYGKGESAAKMKNILKEYPLDADVLKKEFYDLLA